MNKKREMLDIVFGYLGVMLMIFLLNLFNRYIAMSIPIGIRMFLVIVLYWIVALVPVVIMLVRNEKLTDYGFSKKNIPKQLFIGLLVGVAFSVVFTLIPFLVGIGDWVSSSKGYVYWWQFLYEFFFCILAVGLTEEFIFRGFLYAKIEKISNSVVAVMASSVLFGLFHIFNGNIIQVVVTALLGIVFCLCKNKIKDASVLSLAIAHGVYDALIVVLTFMFGG